MYVLQSVYPLKVYLHGSNENKHEMDMSLVNIRDGLIFEFRNFCRWRRFSKSSNLKDGLKGKEFVPEIIEKAKKTTSTDAKC